MEKIGRNDPCPCGSGKKFKKCHMGREEELVREGVEEFSPEASGKITSLPDVEYGRSREMADALDIKKLTGTSMGIRFIDLKKYLDLEEDIRVGDKIITAGGGSRFPCDIPIGEVISTSKDSSGLNMFAIVRPNVKLSSLEEVLIVLND